eukprot:2221776-Pleurochrysis_carterae.AAC.1
MGIGNRPSAKTAIYCQAKPAAPAAVLEIGRCGHQPELYYVERSASDAVTNLGGGTFLMY